MPAAIWRDVMDEREILALVSDLESDRVERKASLSDTDRICEAICAFANDLPGHRAPGIVAIGLDDRSRPTGLRVDDDLLLRLAQMRDNGSIYPFPSMTVSRIVLDGGDVAAVVVEPSTAPPVQHRGRTWIRVGPRRAVATPEEEARLAERRRGAAIPFDARPLAGASLDDLDLDLFRLTVLPQLVAPDVVEANRRTIAEQLAALRLADADGVPTPTGILLCAPEPELWLPGAWVQFLRIEGSTLDGPIRSAHRISAPVPAAMLEMEEVLRAHIDTIVTITGKAVDQRRPNVPFDALQQIVRNAFIHRLYEATAAPVRISWFDDRVEVQSPGGPFGSVDAGNFGRPGVTDYRNPTLATAVAQMGFVQRFGVGIQVARASLERNGNPPPRFDVEPTYVNVVVQVAA